MEKLPIAAAEDVGKKYGLSRVLIIAVDSTGDVTHTVSWGDTKWNCGFAAIDIQKLRAVLQAQPTSLKDAVEVAKLVSASDIKGDGLDELREWKKKAIECYPDLISFGFVP